jgi:hypothetical protein
LRNEIGVQTLSPVSNVLASPWSHPGGADDDDQLIHMSPEMPIIPIILLEYNDAQVLGNTLGHS